ncbi:MAG TPA: hypothetical protein V6C76_01295 [Drouetiella sp.]
MTLVKAWRERQTLWDNYVSKEDRDLLLRLTLWVLMPVFVLLHECGHAAATLLFNGKIAEFDYGFFWGKVVPSGFFTPEQDLIITLAGSVVELICGIISLIAAVNLTSPPVVRLLVYLGMSTLFQTAIGYPMLSLTGMYGDWIQIYTTQAQSWIPWIATVHGIVIAAFLYAVYAKAPKLWFCEKTNPEWAERLRVKLEEIKAKPSEDLYLDLAWLFFEVDLNSFAQHAVDAARTKNPQFVDPLYLEAWIKIGQKKTAAGLASLEELSKNPAANALLQTRALMSIGIVEESEIARKTRGGPIPREMLKRPLDVYTEAAKLSPQLCDPRFYRARTLNKVGLHTTALEELEALTDCNWLDSKLPGLVHDEIDKARRLSSPP